MPRNEKPYIGEMDRRIALSYTTKQPSATGEEQDVDVLINNVWAMVIDKSGTRNDDTDKVVYMNTREYVIRYNSIAWAQRLTLMIIDGADRYTVRHVSEVQRRKFLKLSCVTYE